MELEYSDESLKVLGQKKIEVRACVNCLVQNFYGWVRLILSLILYRIFARFYREERHGRQVLKLFFASVASLAVQNCHIYWMCRTDHEQPVALRPGQTAQACTRLIEYVKKARTSQPDE